MFKQLIISIKKSKRFTFYLGLIAINLATLIFIFGFLKPGELDTDGGIFAAIAYKLLHGGTLYVDTWENKPPGMFFLMEAFFTVLPNKIYALYCCSVFGILALLNALYFVAIALTKSVFISLLALASFLLMAVNGYFMSDGLYTEILGSAMVVWSLYTYHSYITTKLMKYANATTFLLGLAVWFKEPFVCIALPIFIALLVQLKQWKNRLIGIAVGLIPSLLIIVLLAINGSLTAFIEMEINNFRFVDTKDEFISHQHLQILWGGVVYPLITICLLLIGLILKDSFKRQHLSTILFNVLLLLSGLLFIVVSPYSYSHYYLPFTVLIFYSLFSLLKYENLSLRKHQIVLAIILFFSAWKLDQDYIHRFRMSPKPYEEDAFTKVLKTDQKATLFIDHVAASEYYIKSDKVFTTFMPAPIGIHFTNSEAGNVRLHKMYTELHNTPPVFIITNESCSEMLHKFPDPNFYQTHYQKLDSTTKFGEKIYLWKLKN